MTYLVISAVFLGAAVVVALCAAVLLHRSGRPAPFNWLALIAAGVLLLILTAIFDNLMIAVGLFSYAEEQISGIRLGLAPLEDFSYPLAAIILLPALWILLSRVGGGRRQDDH
ncbi:lycopene cyclase domain-containing protein [Nesterenkonia massiliensis]|uniref:lycopene cyclase domain-containing protein n=1 Tax=Nesterenkonia massiliensis TaxID=1232429 RepID=UPI000414EB9D|nr:lycopene cyclase domain-containing protein [Nesterenkonia massiliensis]